MYVKNRKGMQAQLIAAATLENTVAFLSIAGALTAVKAIWASVVSKRAVVNIRHLSYTGGDFTYGCHKQKLAPGIWQWTLFPEPSPSAPYLLLIPFNGMSAEDMLVQVLNRHTLWPVKEQWGKTLWTQGQKLIRRMSTHGLAWAYAVNPVGWDKVIDRAIRNGTLRL